VATGTPEPAALVAACEAAAKVAEDSAERLLSAGGRAELGKEAGAQLLARRRARALCASAASGPGLARVADPASKSRLESQVVRAEQAWRAIPSRPSPGPNTEAR
jgi:hypothetical protein